MKVSEVIVEGWRDYLPKFVPARELEAEKQRKKQQEYVYKQSARFGDQAYKEFEKLMAQQNIKLNDPRTYSAASGINLSDYLKGFALNFFGSDYTTGNLVKNDINKIQVPAQLNPGSIRQYLNTANDKYRDVLKDQFSVQMRQSAEQQQQSQQAVQQLAYGVYMKQIDPTSVPKQLKPQIDAILQNPPKAWQDELAAQQPAEPDQPKQQGPTLAPGVTVLSQEPMVLQVGKKRYYVMDDGLWHEQGNRNPVDSAWNDFLTQQADIATPESPVRTVTAPAPTAKAKPVAQPVRTPARQLTPAEIRQQKQAAATQQIQQQMTPKTKPRIKLLPGETFDQAMDRIRAGQA